MHVAGTHSICHQLLLDLRLCSCCQLCRNYFCLSTLHKGCEPFPRQTFATQKLHACFSAAFCVATAV